LSSDVSRQLFLSSLNSLWNSLCYAGFYRLTNSALLSSLLSRLLCRDLSKNVFLNARPTSNSTKSRAGKNHVKVFTAIFLSSHCSLFSFLL
jgi:hypothetical protein